MNDSNTFFWLGTGFFPTVKLVLDDVVEYFEEIEDKIVVVGLGEEKPRRRE